MGVAVEGQEGKKTATKTRAGLRGALAALREQGAEAVAAEVNKKWSARNGVRKNGMNIYLLECSKWKPDGPKRI